MPALPLKTVLAYLDDTLEPQQLRQVRTQIEQDAELRHLVERIQRVLRDPAVHREGSEASELPPAELIARYVEGTLPEEEAAALEQRCLESDVLLAEVATCHQLIGSGVARPSVIIPPSSYERMYRLLAADKVRASGTASSVRPPGAEAGSPSGTEEGIWLLGAPTLLHGPWTRRLVPLAIVAVFLVGLVLSLYLALTRSATPTSRQAATTQSTPPTEPTSVPDEPAPAEKPAPIALGVQQRRALANWLAWLPMPVGSSGLCPGCLTVAFLPDSAWDNVPEKVVPDDKSKPLVVEAPDFPAQAERLPAECLPRELASLFVPITPPLPGEALLATHAAQGIHETLLWRWSPDERAAQLVKPQERISAGTRVQVWPGFRAVLQVDSGVHLELVGNVPDFHAEPVLDTSLRLHKPEGPYHLDSTLERGWFIITGRKTESLIRLRVAEQVWDLLLPAGNSRLLVSVQWRLQRGQEPPGSQPFLVFYTTQNGVLWRRSGEKEREVIRTVPAGNLVVVQLTRRVGDLAEAPASPDADVLFVPYETLPPWAQPPKLAAPVLEVLAKFQRHVYQRVVENPARPLDGAHQALREEIDETPAHPVSQRLAVFGLAMGNYLEDLLDILEQRPQAHLRQAAREALHYWLGQYPRRSDELRQRIIKGCGYSEAQANALLELLRGYSAPEAGVAESLLRIMQAERSHALRYLAVSNLRELYPHLRDNYSPDANDEMRAKAIAAIRKQLP
ncbi:MAG: hypothetical protein RMJ19_06565 [Gemmatales bacterium]|nr:hypothetical protein [Gemmatales bacterium]MDW8175317.1 hypothetical protein [Gemmatales bacterium]